VAKYTPEAKVGIITIIAVIAGLYFLSNMNLLRKDTGTYYQVSVLFNNVTGLMPNAEVRLNGIRVGKVADIRLAEDKAIVKLDIISDAKIRRSDTLSLSTMGVMGEKYVDIMPGDRSSPLVLDSSTPMEGHDAVGLEELGVSFNVLIKSLQGITDNLKEVTGSFSDVLGNSEGRQMLSDILVNTRNITNNISNLTGGDKSDIAEILKNISEITQSMSQTLPALMQKLDTTAGVTSEILEKDKQSISEIISSLEKIAQNLSTATENLGTITGTVSRGEGSVGKLLMEDETIDNVNQALVSLQEISGEIQNYLSKASSIETYVGYDAEYNHKAEDVKSYVNIKVVPSDEVFYLIQLVNDPYGLETYTTKIYSIDSPSGNTQYTQSEKKIENVLRFSLLYGRRITDFLYLKAGLIESFGGAGADIYLIKDKLSIGLDAWDFSNNEFDPHYKVSLDYRPNDTMFFRVGYDNIANSERRSVVFGAGLSFSDENLKYLLNLMSLGSLAN